MPAGGYHGIYTIPDAPGLAELVVTANGTTASGAPFERGASQFFQIAPQSLSLTGAYHDTAEPNPSDPGLNTALNIDVGVESMYSGTVGISGDLIDAQGKLVAHAMAASGVVTGTATVRLRFDGRDLFAGKRSGPYKLTNLIVLDMRGAALAVVQVKDVFTTQPWDYRRFAPTRLHLPMLRR